MKFPSPKGIGPATKRWSLLDLLTYEAAASGGEPPTMSALDDRYLRDVEVADRYGVHRVTIWAWCRDNEKSAS